MIKSLYNDQSLEKITLQYLINLFAKYSDGCKENETFSSDV